MSWPANDHREGGWKKKCNHNVKIKFPKDKSKNNFHSSTITIKKEEKKAEKEEEELMCIL